MIYAPFQPTPTAVLAVTAAAGVLGGAVGMTACWLAFRAVLRAIDVHAKRVDDLVAEALAERMETTRLLADARDLFEGVAQRLRIWERQHGHD